jgi:predicted ester cyclase
MAAAREGRLMQRERTDRENAELVQRLIEDVCNADDLDRLDTFLAPGYGASEAAMPGSSGTDGIKQALRLFRVAVPDARWTILEQVAAGGTVVTRLQVEGTQRSGLWGIAPTGRMARVTGVLLCRFTHGRVVACWAQADLLGLLCQLGVLPAMDLERVVAVARVLQAGKAWAGRTGQNERRR